MTCSVCGRFARLICTDCVARERRVPLCGRMSCADAHEKAFKEGRFNTKYVSSTLKKGYVAPMDPDVDFSDLEDGAL